MPSTITNNSEAIKELETIRDNLGRARLIQKSVINDAIQSLRNNQPRVAREKLSSPSLRNLKSLKKVMDYCK